MSLEKLGDFYKIANNNITSGITGNGTSEPLGVDDNSYPVYNEKCLFSSIYSCQTGALSDDFTKYQRLRLRVGWHNNSTTTNEGDSYIEVSPEPTAGANVAAIWNVGTGKPGYICVGRVNFPTTTSFSGTVGKLMNFDGNAGNTGWEGRLRPIKEVWGINKQLYKFFALSSEGGSLESNKLLGYRGDTATLTAIPESEDWKCSAINLTGAELTGNDFMFGNSNVTAQAEFEHSRNLTLENGDHGVLSADKMSGFSGDVVTVDATTDEGWYFTGLNITGATATGNKFTFVGNNVTAEGLYTDEGFPVTYESDEHVSITGDNIYIPGSTGITLQTGYDTYYRISGYDVTGGTIENGVLVPTGPCTARAIAKLNAFTATGGWEKGSNVACTSEYDATYSNVPAKYAIHNAHTGEVPASWYATSNRWKPSNVSAYKIQIKTSMAFTGNGVHSYNSQWPDNSVTANLVAGSTQLNQTTKASFNNTWTYSTTQTSNIQNNVYLSAKLYAEGMKAGSWYNPIYYKVTAAYVANSNNSTWSATGYAP